MNIWPNLMFRSEMTGQISFKQCLFPFVKYDNLTDCSKLKIVEFQTVDQIKQIIWILFTSGYTGWFIYLCFVGLDWTSYMIMHPL